MKGDGNTHPGNTPILLNRSASAVSLYLQGLIGSTDSNPTPTDLNPPTGPLSTHDEH